MMTQKHNIQKLSPQPSEISDQGYHVPVLLAEAIEGLRIRPEGTYIDCTLGGGGHARAILNMLGPAGKLIAFDQDTAAAANIPDDPRVIFVHQNFRYLKRFLRLYQIENVDGILADLGVSSHQFDKGERGFSTRFNAGLDMRMDQRQEKTAFTVVQHYTEPQLHKLFEQYGEVTNAKSLAKAIVTIRNSVSLQTTEDFMNGLRGLVKGNPKKYFAQVFQALRIEVNDEMGALKDMLEQAKTLLNSGGRIAIITFHSIEDRTVKNFFRNGSFEVEVDNPFVNKPENEWKLITKKPIVATEAELKMNPRSRSAKLRVAEKK